MPHSGKTAAATIETSKAVITKSPCIAYMITTCGSAHCQYIRAHTSDSTMKPAAAVQLKHAAILSGPTRATCLRSAAMPERGSTPATEFSIVAITCAVAAEIFPSKNRGFSFPKAVKNINSA